MNSDNLVFYDPLQYKKTSSHRRCIQSMTWYTFFANLSIVVSSKLFCQADMRTCDCFDLFYRWYPLSMHPFISWCSLHFYRFKDVSNFKRSHVKFLEAKPYLYTYLFVGDLSVLADRRRFQIHPQTHKPFPPFNHTNSWSMPIQCRLSFYRYRRCLTFKHNRLLTNHKPLHIHRIEYCLSWPYLTYFTI